jgi:hypothetical protein
LLELLNECSGAPLRFGVVLPQCHQPPDPPHPLGLLRARGKWPRRRTAE